MKTKIPDSGPLLIIMAALLWSFDGILRIGLYALPPSVVVFYEHLLGAVILVFFLKKWWPEIKLMTQKEWLAIGVVALFSGALGTVLYTAALAKVNYVSYSVVVLLQQLQPIWAISSAALLLKEKITSKFFLWAGLALIAAYLITFKDLRLNLNTGGQTLTAAIFALLAGVMWGSTTAVSKIVLKKVSGLAATAFRFYLAPIFALLFTIFLGQTSYLFKVTPSQWLSLILITLITGFVALVIYYRGLKKTPARVSTICELVWPGSAIFIDYFYFHRVFSLTQILGVLLLLLSIYKVSRFKR